MSCIFCKIVAGEIPAQILYQDDDVLCFRDVAPQAPTHMLVIPKKHISSIAELESSDINLAGKILVTATQMAKEQGISESGYRVAMNCGEEGGQTVDHIHMHILGGRQMGWPPG
ncbi:MAG: histidine triad nucleotide-binding protein [Pseudomonadales bacterium]|jgi:histidine triad (HIT) family protein|nr:histidine triad nucleotide-binding protein [Pseudomonadales bacterium]